MSFTYCVKHDNLKLSDNPKQNDYQYKRKSPPRYVQITNADHQVDTFQSCVRISQLLDIIITEAPHMGPYHTNYVPTNEPFIKMSYILLKNE